MSIFCLSIIIPTFKRETQINRIIDTLKKQITKNINLEIIICDSFSNYSKKKLKINNKNFKVKYFNIKKNNLSAKRNYGIKRSKFKNIILIDDDCIPKKNFILNYISDLKQINDRSILSGVVEYPAKYISKFNHIRYRNLKHFKNDEFLNDELSPDKVVAMNMAFKKTKLFSSIGLFDERFIGYGFEDHEFAYRYTKKGFKLLRSKASIIHDEGKPSVIMYSKKHYHLGRDGMRNLIKINKSLSEKTIYSKIEKNFFIKFLIYMPFIKVPLLVLEKIIINTDKITNFNFLFLNDYLRLFSYLRGCIDRKKNILNSKNKIWYD